jgi:hypothetical protein
LFFPGENNWTIIDESIDEGEKVKEAIIFVHTKHTWLEPSSDKDKLFLPMKTVISTMANENLKKMISTSIVVLASVVHIHIVPR